MIINKNIRLPALCLSTLLTMLFQSTSAHAGFEDVCEPIFQLNNNQYQRCGNLPVLIPSNDNITNMHLLLSDLGLATIKPAPSLTNSLWQSYQTNVPFEAGTISDFVENKIPNQRKSSEFTRNIYDERCQTLKTGQKDFAQQVKSNVKIPDREKKILLDARAQIIECNSKMPLINVDSSWSATTRQYASYLNASISFYNTNYSTATKIYSVLAKVEDAWLKETAQYMLIRSHLNEAYATGVGQYGDLEVNKINANFLKEYFEQITAYLKLYPKGQYAASARGYLRRGFWLSGRKDLLANEMAWQINNPKSKLYNLDMQTFPEEVDRKIFDGRAINPKIFNDPFLLATYDLMYMRSSTTEAYQPISWSALNAQKEVFKQHPALFNYLQAVHLFYVQKKPQEALRLLPQPSSFNHYLDLSQAFLRGEIIEKTTPQNAAEYWNQLYSKAKNNEQRSLFEAMLVPHLNQKQDFNAFIGNNAKIRQAYFQRRFMTQFANENSLKNITQAKQSTADQKQLAVYTLLIKSLSHQNFNLFNETYPLLPTDAAQYQGSQTDNKYKDKPPFANFIWNGSTITPALKCPDLKNLSLKLAHTPKDLFLNVCLGEYVRSDKAYTYDLFQYEDKVFKGPLFARGNTYKEIIKNGPKGDLQAYALYRAIQCYAPSGINDCGDEEVSKSVRKQWYDRIKSEYPNTSWAKSLKYYW